MSRKRNSYGFVSSIRRLLSFHLSSMVHPKSVYSTLLTIYVGVLEHRRTRYNILLPADSIQRTDRLRQNTLARNIFRVFKPDPQIALPRPETSPSIDLPFPRQFPQLTLRLCERGTAMHLRRPMPRLFPQVLPSSLAKSGNSPGNGNARGNGRD